MTGNNEEKIIKNPDRNSEETDTAEYERYVPQYLVHGMNPTKVDFAPRENLSVVSELDLSDDNGRLRDSGFSDAHELPIETTSIPNVGNNSDHFWTKVDGEKLEESKTPVTYKDVGNDQYVLIAKGKIILIGTLEQIESEVREVFYENNEEYKNKKITIEDLLVFKKVKIKIGVFLED